jgi:uncharacterized membrane-anchored protein YitT (DUF2179 family)
VTQREVVVRQLGNAGLIALAILAAGMGLKGFLVSSNFIDGGVAGISMLLAKVSGLSLPILLRGIDEYSAVTIMSGSHDAIRKRIVYKGYGGASGTEQDVLYCVVTRLEIGKLKAIVRDLDPRAFVVYHPLAGADGGTLKRTRIH